MKLTKQQLKQIIKEELESVLEEGFLDRLLAWDQSAATGMAHLASKIPGGGAKKQCDKLKEQLDVVGNSLDRHDAMKSGWDHTPAWNNRRKELFAAKRRIEEEMAAARCTK